MSRLAQVHNHHTCTKAQLRNMSLGNSIFVRQEMAGLCNLPTLTFEPAACHLEMAMWPIIKLNIHIGHFKCLKWLTHILQSFLKLSFMAVLLILYSGMGWDNISEGAILTCLGWPNSMGLSPHGSVGRSAYERSLSLSSPGNTPS